MVEMAIVLMVLLTLVFGMFDLGLGVFRSNTTAQVAREAARQASVHGEMAPPRMNQWGPTTFTAKADADNEVTNAIRPFLAGLTPADTTLTLEWPDGNAQPESRVRATISTTHQSFIGFIFGNQTKTLTATSTVQINH
jgi:Flp pilus assembly protein TadG